MSYRHVHSTKEISMFRACPRSWAAKYLFRADDPKHPNAQLGIDVHQLLERMLSEGPAANTQPESEIGALARALYPLAPAGAEAEIGAEFEVHADGRTHRASFKLDWALQVPGRGWVGFGDFKTCAGEKWALAGRLASPEKQQAALANDLQANLETAGFLQVTGGASPASSTALRWCYVDKKTLKAWPVQATLTYAGATEWLEANAVPTMRLIEQLRTAWHEQGWRPDLSAFPLNPLSCQRVTRDGVVINCNFHGQCQFRPAPVTIEKLYQLSR